MDFNCEYFKSAMHSIFKSIGKRDGPREQEWHRHKSQDRRSEELREVKRQRRINRENDERRGGEIVTAMRQKFTTRSSINHSNHNGSSH